MATIQDIFDWLNQGAQGDIPGTGGEQPNAPQSSQSAQPQATPVGSLHGFGDPNAQEKAGIFEPQLVPWLFAPDQNIVTPERLRQPMPQQEPANEASAEPSAQEAAEKGRQAGQKAGQGLWAMLFGKQPQKTPGDYAGQIPPSLMDHYNALIESGLPPDVAHSILTQPSVGEGEDTLATALHTWPYPYAGSQQEYQSAQQSPPSYQSLWDQLMTPPTYEDQ